MTSSLLIALLAAAAAAPPDTLPGVVPLPTVEVSTARVSERAPVARTVLGRDEITRRNQGQDTPMALATLPGAYAYSDAGNGIGYSYLSVRGFPQRRVSVLINGIPLNDPESHEVYWIDHPDLLASTSELTLQRGAGTALYGAASLGGTVNLELSPFSDAPRFTATAAAGSWDTKRLALEASSGRLAGGWDLYGRYSRIESDGYRDQSWSTLWSYALAARRTFERQSLRINLYGGPEETHLAYLGVPAPYLNGAISGDADRDRRFNPIQYAGERDHFFEPHYELIHAWAPSAGLAITNTLFYFDGDGYYDEQRFGLSLADYRLAPWQVADSTLYPRDYYAQNPDGSLVEDGSGRFTVVSTDLVRRRSIENRHYGWIPRARIAHAGGTLTVGGELRGHDGRHVGEVLSGNALPPGAAPDHDYYDYHPRTLSGALFVREEWTPYRDLLVTADLAWRHQGYFMRGDQFDGIEFDQTYDFGLPRLGVTWTPRADLTTFASWGYAAREPAFRDLYDAEGVGSVPLYGIVDVPNNVYEDPLITPETVQDLELGAAWRSARTALTVNLFRQDFRDELVYAGQFNTDLGYPILGNAARSVHQGIELAGRVEQPFAGAARFVLDANATLSDNHFKEYAEVYGTNPGDTLHYDGNAIGFFPATLANVSARGDWRGTSLGLEAQYAGRLHVDNTETIVNSAGPRTVVNLIGGWRMPVGGASAELSLRVNNVFDVRYAAGGYMDFDATGAYVPHFVVAATRNVLGQVRVEF